MGNVAVYAIGVVIECGIRFPFGVIPLLEELDEKRICVRKMVEMETRMVDMLRGMLWEGRFGAKMARIRIMELSSEYGQ
jgi:hypothetical protein